MKKIIMLFSIVMLSCSLFVTRTNATTLAASDVRYWVGSGSNSATLVVDFNNNVGAFALGYRWNGSKKVGDMLQTFVDSISGLTINGISAGFIDHIAYVDSCNMIYLDNDTLDGMGWMYSVNDVMAPVGINGQDIADGDEVYFVFIDSWMGSIACPPNLAITYPVRFAETVTATYNDTIAYGYNYTSYGFNVLSWNLTLGDTILTRVQQNASPCVDDTIYVVNLHVFNDAPALPELDFADINWWVGNGENQSMFIIDWTVDSVAVAFGYRWSGDKTVADMMDEVAAAVPGLTIEGASAGFVTSICYVDTDNHVNEVDTVFGNGYWMYTINNDIISLAANAQPMINDGIVYWEYHTNTENYNVYMPTDLSPIYPIAPAVTAISYANVMEMVLSPIPAVDVLTIRAAEVMESVVVFAANGTKLMEARPMEAQATLNVSALEQGLYVVLARMADGSVAIQKFTK